MLSRPNHERSAFRFSLKTALLLVIPVAAGAAALRDASQLWVSLVTTATLLCVLAAIVATIFGDPKRRAFRGGFAVCCGGYFLLFWITYPASGVLVGQDSILRELATTKALYALHDRLYQNSSVVLYPNGIDFGGFGGGGVGSAFGASPGGLKNGGAFQVPDSDASDASKEDDSQPGAVAYQGANSAAQAPMTDYGRARNFLTIGQCLWAWILGWIGGVFAQIVSRRQVRTNDAQNAASSAESPASAAKTV